MRTETRYGSVSKVEEVKRLVERLERRLRELLVDADIDGSGYGEEEWEGAVKADGVAFGWGYCVAASLLMMPDSRVVWMPRERVCRLEFARECDCRLVCPNRSKARMGSSVSV
jgi:hypothetical protein